MIPQHLTAGLHRHLGLLTRDLKKVDARHPHTVHTALAITDQLIQQLTDLREWLADKLDDETHQAEDHKD